MARKKPHPKTPVSQAEATPIVVYRHDVFNLVALYLAQLGQPERDIRLALHELTATELRALDSIAKLVTARLASE